MIGSDGVDLRKPFLKVLRAQRAQAQVHLTRISPADGVELFIACSPDPRSGRDVRAQVRSLYQGVFECLRAEGASPSQVVRETVYFRDATAGLEARRALQMERSGEFPWESFTPASLFVEEPPSVEGQFCEAQLHVVIPAAGRKARWWNFASPLASGKALALDGQRHFWIGNVLGKPGGDFFSEALSMFEKAGSLLATQGATFPQVVRTWIYLREMERDYAELNRARRAFFGTRGVQRRPASTGIGGAPPGAAHRSVMSLYAVTGLEPSAVEIMTTPTLNEAHEYGSDFSRGMKVRDGGRRTLFISGTASVDAEGLTVAVGDFDAQVERMLLNVETLLENEGASFEDVASAVTYLKEIRDTARFRSALARRGLPDFPHSIVKAEVCRPELLCEMEAIAVVPADRRC